VSGFEAPWQAQAFAMTQALIERGLFTSAEWSAALAAEIRRAQHAGDPDLGDTYYQHWLAALEGLVAARGMTTGEELSRYQRAWGRAAQRTPHGMPIVLADEDLSPGAG
jgi:nitrile hydratase accessory protein